MSWTKIEEYLNLKKLELPHFQILDTNDDPVPCQIDHLDPHDPAKDELVFLADVPERSTAIYRISETESEKSETLSTSSVHSLKNSEKWDYTLANNDIEIKFHRGRTDFGHMAGSVFYARMMSGAEMTNPYQKPDVREWAKRLMQVEYAFIKLPWSPDKKMRWYFCDNDYEYVNSGEGAVRLFLTVRAPFEICFEDPVRSGPGNIVTRYSCHLYRILSLFNGKDYVCEDSYAEIWKYEKIWKYEENVIIDRVNFRISEGHITLPMCFALTFYMHTPGLRGSGLDFRKINPCPDWFAVGNNAFPHPGIGFACNTHIGNLDDMGDYFRWNLLPTWHVRCLHQLMDGRNVPKVGDEFNFGHVVGNNWYDMIYTPLWGEII